MVRKTKVGRNNVEYFPQSASVLPVVKTKAFIYWKSTPAACCLIEECFKAQEQQKNKMKPIFRLIRLVLMGWFYPMLTRPLRALAQAG
ncbi:MAG: hypothetical protein ACXV8Q_09110 [Methylobacter sp.]